MDVLASDYNVTHSLTITLTGHAGLPPKTHEIGLSSPELYLYNEVKKYYKKERKNTNSSLVSRYLVITIRA